MKIVLNSESNEASVGLQTFQGGSPDEALGAALRELALGEAGPLTIEVQFDPKGRDSMYRGSRMFDREQLVFMVETILSAATDRLDNWMPDNLPLEEYRKLAPQDDYEMDSIMGMVGMSLSILYAQLTNDGMGASDANECLALDGVTFEHACQQVLKVSWADDGEKVRAAWKKIRNEGKAISYREVYGSIGVNYPDERKYAEAFVDRVFADYL